MPFNVPALRSAVERVRRGTAGRVPIAVGGHACRCDSGLARQVQAEVTGGNDNEFLAAVKAFFKTPQTSMV